MGFSRRDYGGVRLGRYVKGVYVSLYELEYEVVHVKFISAVSCYLTCFLDRYYPVTKEYVHGCRSSTP